MMFKAQRGEKGFTLIELLIVIAIIGILAAIAIPAYTGYTRKAKVQEVIGAMGSVKTAVMAYYTESPPTNATNTWEGGGLAASADEIRTRLGVDVPVKYLTSITVSDAGVITATLNNVIGGDATGDVTLTPTMADGLKTWTWGGSLPPQYRPKN